MIREALAFEIIQNPTQQQNGINLMNDMKCHSIAV